MDKVVSGTMKVYEKILGLRYIKDTENAPYWHSTVEKFLVYDEETNEFFGSFYLDLFPRKGKYSHAACFPMDVRFVRTTGEVQYTSSCMIANFSPPSENQKSLFLFSEVQLK